MSAMLIDLDGFKLDLMARGRSTETIRNRLSALKNFRESLEHDGVSPEFTESNCRNYLAKRSSEISGSGMNHYIKTFKAYCQYTQIEPFPFLKKQKENRKAPLKFRRNEAMAFLKLYPESPYTLLWKIHCWYGLRPKNIRYMKKEDIYDDCIILPTSKTKKGAVLPIPEHLREELLKYVAELPDGGYLFPSPTKKGQPISHTAVGNDFKKRCEVLGLKLRYSPYTFRRSFGSRNGRKNLASTQEMMLHSTPAQTKEYILEDLDELQKFVDSDTWAIENMPAKEQLLQFTEEVDKLIKIYGMSFEIILSKASNQYKLEVAIKEQEDHSVLDGKKRAVGTTGATTSNKIP